MQQAPRPSFRSGAGRSLAQTGLGPGTSDPRPLARESPTPSAAIDETTEQIAEDVAAVGRLGVVPTLLQVLCESTGMGFAAVARVSDTSWTACAVYDAIGFGLRPGAQLGLHTTLCMESREARAPIVIDHASEDSRYRDHATPKLYKIESYASFPIVLAGDDYFGNLCAIDPRPARIDEPWVRAMFERFAALIATQLEEERRHEETQAALMSERAVAESREQFIAILGHDLRNPLAVVSACALLLKRRAADPGSGRLADQMLRSVDRMSGLIGDTLDFAKGRLGGGLSLDLQWTEGLAAAIDEIAAAARLSHPGRRIESNVVVDRAARCDIARIQQIASNLVDNAIAHGWVDGLVTIGAQCRQDAFELSVWNQGDPIPSESIDRMFDPFWRHDSGRPHDGLGLGLHICTLIAEAHGGSISVSSSRERGTLFVVRIPIAGPPADEDQGQDAVAGGASCELGGKLGGHRTGER